MSLEDLVKEADPSKKDGHCPECGTEGKEYPEEARSELKCPAPQDECEVSYWFET